ncbi:MAG: response regulator transcription factor [Ilumatobacter sp.]|nr:response regulator transcription factor [Ilumatobacter sp.]
MNGGVDGGGRRGVESLIEVVIADDHPLVLQGLRAVISGTDDIRVVGEAADGAAAIEVVLDREPDVAIVDLDMPEVHGVEVTRRITEALPSTTVIVLTMLDDDDTVLAALRAGASGYLLKGTSGANILSAIRSAAAGTAVLDPGLLGGLAGRASQAPADTPEPFPELTARERDILTHIADGLTNAEIGDRLHLSAKTIANNVSTILTKLQVTQRGQAIVLAREAGLGIKRQQKS